MLISLLLFVLILGLIVLVHEFGHFIWAKWFGVHVYEFSIGMGPKIWGTKPDKSGTTYNIRAFPIGGFVALAGEDQEDDSDVPKKKMLYNKPIWQRFLVMFFGAGNNFILGFLVLFFVALFGGATKLDPVINKLDESYPMYQEGLREGDKIVSIGKYNVSTVDDIALFLTIYSSDGDSVDIKVKRDNKEMIYNVAPAKLEYAFGVTLSQNDEKPTVVDVTKDYPFEKGGLKKGDIFTKVNDVPVNSLEDFNKCVYDSRVNGTALSFEIKRGEESIVINATPKKEDTPTYAFGIDFTGVDNVSGFTSAIKYAFQKFGAIIKQLVIVLKCLFTGELSIKNLSGPVGIYSVVDQTRSVGAASMFALLAMLSINVGFVNLIPFPAFDGGRILFLLIEKIKGSPISPKVENTFNTVGFALLMLLLVIITFNDVLNLL